MNLKDFTIIIPCISFKDVRESLKKIRKHYKKIKIIISLNKYLSRNVKDKNLKIIISKYKSIGKKRNIAVNSCNTKYLAFIDSDAYPAKNWIESSFKYIKKKNVGIVSGPHIDPPNQNYFQKIIGLVKKSFLITMKPGLQKNNNKKEIVQFTSFLPSANWIISRKIFNSLNQMDEKMLRNEDWDFVYNRMKKTNYKLLYSPDVLIYHKNGTVFHLIKKRFLYGFYMWPILVKLNSQNYYFLIPLIFVIFLLSFPLIFYFKSYLIFYLSVLSVYTFAVLLESIRLSRNLLDFIFLLPILICANISPGIGIFLGLYNHVRAKLINDNN